MWHRTDGKRQQNLAFWRSAKRPSYMRVSIKKTFLFSCFLGVMLVFEVILIRSDSYFSLFVWLRLVSGIHVVFLTKSKHNVSIKSASAMAYHSITVPVTCYSGEGVVLSPKCKLREWFRRIGISLYLDFLLSNNSRMDLRVDFPVHSERCQLSPRGKVAKKNFWTRQSYTNSLNYELTANGLSVMSPSSDVVVGPLWPRKGRWCQNDPLLSFNTI